MKWKNKEKKREKDKAEEETKEQKIFAQSEKEWSDCEAAPCSVPGHPLQKACKEKHR